MAGAILAPGDEVLLLAPHWPLITGIVRSFGGVPVDVPFFGAADSPETAVEAVRERLTERTVALYLNTPSNPTGRLIPRSWIEALVEWAAREDLWIIADEVYEDYVYEGEHTYTPPVRARAHLRGPLLLQGLRHGGQPLRLRGRAGAGPSASCARSACTASTARRPPRRSPPGGCSTGPGTPGSPKAREQYRATGAKVAARLGLPAPQGSTFLFFDVAALLDETGLGGFLERCVDRGLFLAPGPSFGPYPTHVRLCFTAAPPDAVERGVEALAPLLR